MKVLSSKIHGILDYVVSVLLIASPWLFGFGVNGHETAIPVVLGITTILYSLLTNYEYSIATVIPFRLHLVLDLLSGLLLAASPWIFGFYDRVYLPHLVVGIAELGVVLLSRPYPGLKAVSR